MGIGPSMRRRCWLLGRGPACILARKAGRRSSMTKASSGTDDAAQAAGSAGPESPSTGGPEPAVATGQELPGQVAELVEDLSKTGSVAGMRRLTSATVRAAGRGGQVTWRGARAASRWLADPGIAMATRVPGRDQAALRAPV